MSAMAKLAVLWIVEISNPWSPNHATIAHGLHVHSSGDVVGLHCGLWWRLHALNFSLQDGELLSDLRCLHGF